MSKSHSNWWKSVPAQSRGPGGSWISLVQSLDNLGRNRVWNPFTAHKFIDIGIGEYNRIN